MLRVVRCLPDVQAYEGMVTHADGVAQASREETAACPDAVRGS